MLCPVKCVAGKEIVAARPNTRVQRTRSSPSALRSPLTRYPLGPEMRSGPHFATRWALKKMPRRAALVQPLSGRWHQSPILARRPTVFRPSKVSRWGAEAKSKQRRVHRKRRNRGAPVCASLLDRRVCPNAREPLGDYLRRRAFRRFAANLGSRVSR
jgi:hypothetical protein